MTGAPHNREPLLASRRKVRAYTLIERVRGESEYIVYGTSAADARERFEQGDRGFFIDMNTEPRGVASVRRNPDEDPDA